MTVRPTSERMVFAVTSASRKNMEYRVDLTALAGASECSCTDWMTRRHLAIKAGEPVGTRATCCKHVLAARHSFLNSLLADMAQSETA